MKELATDVNAATIVQAIRVYGGLDFRNDQLSSLPLELALVDHLAAPQRSITRQQNRHLSRLGGERSRRRKRRPFQPQRLPNQDPNQLSRSTLHRKTRDYLTSSQSRK